LAKALLLQRHPATASSASTLPTWFGRRADSMLLTYRIPGDTSALLFPPRRPSEFADNLWEHTCFEAFVRPQGHHDYLEFNFSPSTLWAAYHLDGYREGLKRAAVGVRKIVATNPPYRFELSVRFDLPPEWAPLTWQLNLSAILEEKDGSKSYWALAHPPGDPDFHHPDCFVLDLPPPAEP
jgi:hypothetical protein